MHPLDRLFEKSSRSLAQRTSRRSFVAVLGQVLTGTLLLPLLPIDRVNRAEAAAAAGAALPPPHQPSDDPQSLVRHPHFDRCLADVFPVCIDLERAFGF